MAQRICAVEGCERNAHCRGWCRAHYGRWKATGDVGDAVIREYSRVICAVDECERPHVARGYCYAHYDRFMRNGDSGQAAVRIHDPSRVCSVDGCSITVAGRGMCRTHWARVWRTGSAGSAEIKHLTDPTARNEAGEKRCPSCGEWLPVVEYTKCASTPDGLWKQCKKCNRASTLLRSYNLTLEAYEAILDGQGGACLICSKKPDGPYSLHVDHDHSCCPVRKRSCGKCIRGLLCSPCNTSLGLLMDDPGRFRAAADYLERRRDRG